MLFIPSQSLLIRKTEDYRLEIEFGTDAPQIPQSRIIAGPLAPEPRFLLPQPFSVRGSE